MFNEEKGGKKSAGRIASYTRQKFAAMPAHHNHSTHFSSHFTFIGENDIEIEATVYGDRFAVMNANFAPCSAHSVFGRKNLFALLIFAVVIGNASRFSDVLIIIQPV